VRGDRLANALSDRVAAWQGLNRNALCCNITGKTRSRINIGRTGEPYAGNFVALPRNLFPKNFGARDLASKFPRGPRPYLHPYSVIAL
jgi:hypothetical protein